MREASRHFDIPCADRSAPERAPAEAPGNLERLQSRACRERYDVDLVTGRLYWQSLLDEGRHASSNALARALKLEPVESPKCCA